MKGLSINLIYRSIIYTEGLMKNLSHDRRYLGPDLNTGLLGYEAGHSTAATIHIEFIVIRAWRVHRTPMVKKASRYGG
jgi:hypothetical protein